MSQLAVTQLSADSFSEPANSSGWFDGAFYRDRYFVGARGTSGLVIIDYIDPENPVKVGEAQISFNPATMPGNFARSKGLILIGDSAFVCCRRGFGTNPGFGIIEEFDISDVANPVATGNIYDPNNSQLVAPNPPLAYSYLWSAVATDGVHLFVAGQISGLYKFLLSNLSKGPVAAIESQNLGDPIETQGVAYDPLNDVVLFANYTYGLRIIDNKTWGQDVDVVVASYNTGTVNLRPWQVTTNLGWAYVCVNVNAPNEDSVERGLLTLDLRNGVENLTDADWNYAQIPSQFNDTWNGAGDAPQLDIEVFDDNCYVSNGQIGVAAWNVKNPASPIFSGSFGELIPGDNLYLTKVGRLGGKNVLVYGDGFQLGGAGSKSLYLAEIETMTFNIGNYSDSTVDDGNAFLDAASPRGPNASLDYVAKPGDRITQFWCFVNVDPAADRTLNVGLYRMDTGALVWSAAVDNPTPWVIPAAGAAPGALTFSLDTPFDLTPGITYSIRAAVTFNNAALRSNHTTSGLVGITSTGPGSGGLLDPLSGESAWAGNHPYLAFRGINVAGKNNPVIGGVGDSTTTPARDNGGDVAVTPVGGVSSSIIGACPNEAYSEGPIMTEYAGGRPTTMAADHVFRYIGGGASTANETGSPSGPDTEVTHEARIYDAETDTFGTKAVRQVLANDSADPYAPGAAVAPSTFLNDTNPEEDVEAGEGVFGVEP